MNQQAPKQFAEKFWLLWGSQAASLAGSFAVQFAIIWWLTSTTGSATILATAAFIGLLPQVVLGPFIGALVDRWNRKRVMLIADSVIALASAWLAWMFYMDAASIAHVFVVLGVRAIGGAFHAPAMLASTSLMCPKSTTFGSRASTRRCKMVLHCSLPRSARCSYPGCRCRRF
jgi:DHA3 family macrolide efflux protein-like MFS transporter